MMRLIGTLLSPVAMFIVFISFLVYLVGLGLMTAADWITDGLLNNYHRIFYE